MNGRAENGERNKEKLHEEKKKRPGDVAQSVEHLPREHKALGSIAKLYTLSVGMSEAGRVPGHPQLHREFKETITTVRKPQPVTRPGGGATPVLCYTGINIILGVLFYLMQARKFLQEGMTYTLGSSFYLAWINVFFFFMIGLAGLWCGLSVQMVLGGLLGVGVVFHTGPGRVGLGLEPGLGVPVGLGWVGD